MSADNPRAFRVQNPVLTPTPLAGNPANVLSNWSFVVTPREDGSTEINSGGTEPIWAQGLGPNGDKGTMIQNSDSFNTQDNVATGTTNFIAPTAVAGDVNWSNYVYSARFISSDNDGFGLVLRYQNESNFYRMRFAPGSTSGYRYSYGIKQGRLYPKNVNLVFEEVSRPPTSSLPIYTPMDVYAVINSNRLQVLIIPDPAGPAPVPFLVGPLEITGPTVDTGKIGVFSWAQYQNAGGNATSDAGTEVDSVKVQKLEGEGLLVSSLYGTPTPDFGLNDLPSGGTVTASVTSPVVTAPGVRQIAIGWNGFGSVPPPGPTARRNSPSTSSLPSRGSGRRNSPSTHPPVLEARCPVPPAHGCGRRSGGNCRHCQCRANVHGWSGDSASTETNLVFTMTQPISLQANFAADSDSDQLPDPWGDAVFWQPRPNGC